MRPVRKLVSARFFAGEGSYLDQLTNMSVTQENADHFHRAEKFTSTVDLAQAKAAINVTASSR